MSSAELTGPDFEVNVQRSSGTAVVQVAGESDLASAPTLTDVLRSLEPPCDRLILDLSRLTFIDSTGLRLGIARAPPRRAGRLRLRARGSDSAVDREILVQRFLPLARSLAQR